MSLMNWERIRRIARMRRRNRAPVMTLDQVPPGRTGVRGVYFAADKGKYRAAIEVAGKRHHLGYFVTAAEAGAVYDAAARAAWGAAAITNDMILREKTA